MVAIECSAGPERQLLLLYSTGATAVPPRDAIRGTIVQEMGCQLPFQHGHIFGHFWARALLFPE